MDTKVLDRFKDWLGNAVEADYEVYKRNYFEIQILKTQLSNLPNAKADEIQRWETAIGLNDPDGDTRLIFEVNGGLPDYFIDSLVRLIKETIERYEAENKAIEEKYGYTMQK